MRVYITDIQTGLAVDSVTVQQVMLNEGPAPAAFQTAGANVQAELAMCQRYFYRLTGDIYGQFAGVGTGIRGQLMIPVTQRIAVTPARNGSLGSPNLHFEVTSVGPSGTISAVTMGSTLTISNPGVIELGFSVTPSLGAGRIRIIGDSSIDFNAEL